MATILVVDDRPTNRQFLVTLLGYAGHTLLEANDGVEALEIVRMRRPDLVITDMRMPRMEGQELVRQVRSDPAIAGTRFVLYTATYRAREAAEIARQVEVQYILSKPSEPEVILATVGDALAGLPQAAAEDQGAARKEQLDEVIRRTAENAAALQTVSMRMAALIELSMDLVTERNLETMVQHYCGAARDIVGAEHCCTGIFGPTSKSVSVFHFDDVDPSWAGPAEMDCTTGALGRVVGEQRVVRLHDLQWNHGLPEYRVPIRSFLGVPMFSSDRVFGWTCFFNKMGAEAFSVDDERLAVTIAAQATVAYRRMELDQELDVRNRQQAAIARLGSRAMALTDLNAIFQEATAIAAETLGVEFCKVLELLPEGKELRLRAGVGWRPGLLGKATVPTDRDSQAGFTLLADGPVVVEDLRTERRFRGPPLLHEHGVVSGLSVVIRGPKRPFGVMGVHTARPRQFNASDVSFLQGVANILAIAIERKQADDQLRERSHLTEFSADVSASLARAESLRPMLQQCTEAMVRHLRAAFARIWTLGGDGKLLELQASAGLYTHIDGGHARVPVGNFKIGLIAQERKAHLTNDVLHDPRVSDPDWAEREGMVSFAGYPLIVEDRLVGVMAMFAREPLSTETLEAMGSVANTIAIGIQRKRSAELARQRAAFLDQARDAILVRDLSGTIVYWNDGASRLYGWTAREALGKSADELLYATPGVQTAEPRSIVLDKGEWAGELKQVAKGGREILVQSRWTLMNDESGRKTSILSINTDVTEAKRIQAQVMRNQRLESIGQLAGGIAHDLNNALTPIMMSLNMLEKRLPDPANKPLFAALNASVNRGADMVKQILSFARGIEGERCVVDPRDLLKDLGAMLHHTLPKSIHISFSSPGDLWTVMGDVTQLHQMLLNLCVNARDAMPDGGNLWITAANNMLDEQFVHMHADAGPGPYVVLTVADTGTGIPAGVMDHIFDPFFTTKEPGKGTGLGLSTALGVARSHGGFVTAYSEVGKGSKFVVYLPAVETSAIKEMQAKRTELPDGNGELILVVDDEPAICEITQQTLEDCGYQVVTAADGAEAVAVFAERRSDIRAILTDMMMPIMDGAAAIRAFRRLDTKIPILAASGLKTSGASDSVSNLVQGFLNKPYSADKLLALLHEVLHPPAAAAGEAPPANGPARPPPTAGPSRSVTVIVPPEKMIMQ